MKKVELHLHLDGSVRPETLLDLGLEYGVVDNNSDIEEISKSVSINSEDRDLVDYLKKFNLPIAVMQTKEALERVSYELVEDLYTEDTIYAEIRFAPLFHTSKGLSYSEIVQSVLHGLNRAMEKYPIKANLILCAMRHLNEDENSYLLDLINEFKGKGVVAIDLAGDEKNFPVTLFKDFFRKVRELDIPFTIHAGEASGPESIREAIALGASRIGHGIRAFEDPDVINLIKDRNITLECCPKSNIDTRVFKDFKSYPLMDYIKWGLNVTLSSDNRTVSDTNIDNEIELLSRYFNLSTIQIDKLNINAINSAFISDNEKKELIEIYRR